MKRLIALSVVVTCLCLVANVEARTHRVDQIPNGQEFECTTCHVGPNPVQNLQEDGPRNDFGQQVEDNLIGSAASGDVDWLGVYDMDADGDGYTNGEELGDPMGEWVQGDAPPQDYEPSHPAEADDTPDFQGCDDGEVFNPETDECEAIDEGEPDAGGGGEADAGSGEDAGSGDGDDGTDDGMGAGEDDRGCASTGSGGVPVGFGLSILVVIGLATLRRQAYGVRR